MSVWDHYDRQQAAKVFAEDFDFLAEQSRRVLILRKVNWWLEWVGLRLRMREGSEALLLKARIKGTVLFGLFMVAAGVFFTAPVFPDVLEGERVAHLLVILGMFLGNGLWVLYLERQEWRQETARDFWRFVEELLEEEIAKEAEFEGGNP